MKRRNFLKTMGGGAFASLCPVSASVAQLVTRPLRIVFPFAAGGVADSMARLIGERLRISLDRPVIVENIIGAAGRRGVQYVVSAKPDGDVLLFTPSSQICIYPHVYSALEYNPFTDLKPVSQVSSFDFGLAVGPKIKATNLRGLVDWVKANPAQANYATAAAGSLPHFFAVMFAKAAGVELLNVPYGGSAAALAGLIGDQIPMLFTTTAELVQYHKDNRLRILATSGDKRSPFVDDVPTFKESGYEIAGEGWYAVYAPAKTPDAEVNRLSEAISGVLREPALAERIGALGMVPNGTTPAQLAAIQKADYDKWGPVVKASGFKPTD